MPKVMFTIADTARPIDRSSEYVIRLWQQNVIAAAAYTPRGRPIFDADGLRRAALHVTRPEGKPSA
jgi:hypothetical protein